MKNDFGLLCSAHKMAPEKTASPKECETAFAEAHERSRASAEPSAAKSFSGPLIGYICIVN